MQHGFAIHSGLAAVVKRGEQRLEVAIVKAEMPAGMVMMRGAG